MRWVERPGLPGWRLCNSGVSSSGRCCGNTVALLVWAGWYALVGLNLRPYQRFMGLSVFLYDGARCSAKGNRCWCSGGRVQRDVRALYCPLAACWWWSVITVSQSTCVSVAGMYCLLQDCSGLGYSSQVVGCCVTSCWLVHCWA